jgi:hypothetical protein
VLDVVQREHELIGVLLGTAAELAPVVAEHGFDRHAYA